MVQILSNMIRPVVWSLLLAILVGTISTVSSISLMGLSAWLIASAALQPPLYVLSLAIVGVRFCGVMRAVFRYLERYFTHKVGFSLFTSFRVFVLTKIIKALPFKQQTENGDAFDLIVNAVDNLRDSFLRFFLPPIITTISVFILSIWFFIYSYDLMILLISSWLIFMIAIPYMTWRRYLKLKKHKFLLTQEIIEFYEGNRELSFYNYDKYRLKNINHSIEQYQQYQQNLFKLKLKVNLCSEFIMGAYLVICLAISIYLVNTQDFNPIMAITIILTYQAILEVLAMMPSLIEHFDEASKRWQDLAIFMQEKKFIADTNNEVKNENQEDKQSKDVQLLLKDLAYGYDKVLLRDINLSIKKGNKTLIVGTSGCGKSTLFYVLMRLLYPLKGNIFIQGKNYDDLAEKSIREHFAVAFQEHHIFNLSIRDNFKMLYENITDEEIYKSLENVYLLDFVKQVGLDYIVGNDGNKLSGGQKHRLQLAICLAKQKDIILLDEPTAGLDIKTTNNICSQLMEKYQKQTMIVTSHDISLLRFFDDIIICGEEKIIEQGNIKKLLLREDSYLNKLIRYKNFI